MFPGSTVVATDVVGSAHDIADVGRSSDVDAMIVVLDKLWIVEVTGGTIVVAISVKIGESVVDTAEVSSRVVLPMLVVSKIVDSMNVVASALYVCSKVVSGAALVSICVVSIVVKIANPGVLG